MKKIIIPPQSKEEIEKIRNDFYRDNIAKYNKKDKIQRLVIKVYLAEGEGDYENANKKILK
jgi:hypothetical protein